MKILMFYAPSFWFKTFEKALEEVEDVQAEAETTDSIVVFYQAEAGDEARPEKIVTKMTKNIKWLAGKFRAESVVLHSFNHLSASKASPEFARLLADRVRQRLEQANYKVLLTPFGYLNEWKIHVAGQSLAKVYKEI